MSWGAGGMNSMMGWAGGNAGGMRGWGGGPGGGGNRGELMASDQDLGKAFDFHLLSRLFTGYIWPYKKRAAAGGVAMLFLQAANILQPLIEGKAIDAVNGGSFDNLAKFGFIYFVSICVAWFGQYQQVYQMTWVGQYALYDIASSMFRHIMKLSLGFFDRNETGRIMSRVQNDVNVLQQLLASGMIQTLGNLLQLVGIVVTIFIVNWRLAFLATSCLPLFAIVLMVWQKYARKSFRAARATISVVNSSLQENVSGVRVIQSLGREQRNYSQFETANAANLNANLGAGRVAAATAPMLEVVQAIALALVLFFGGSMVLSGTLTIGLLFAFTRYVDRFFNPLRQLMQEYNQFQRGTVAMERIFEILDTVEEIKDAPDAIELPTIEGRVTYDHVSFSYVPGVDVIKDLDLDIAAGQKVAFVGQTGAGKSTITSLLMRFYEVTDGAVRIDGHDIRDVTMESLRDQIGVVLQDAVLFSGTIADNIRYGRMEATDEEVHRAAQVVGAAEFIEQMPKGYDTHVQERGVGISIGQRQLIAFARALLVNPRILILDEATASLDTTSELIVSRGIKELTQGRTSLIIAHRLSTIRDADRIVVLENGRIIEQGTHDELIVQHGAYYRLYSLGFQETGVVVQEEPLPPQQTRAGRRAIAGSGGAAGGGGGGRRGT